MRAHRGEARARQAAYDFGLFRRAFAKPIDWGDVGDSHRTPGSRVTYVYNDLPQLIEGEPGWRQVPGDGLTYVKR